jgi:hypothetical protein
MHLELFSKLYYLDSKSWNVICRYYRPAGPCVLANAVLVQRKLKTPGPDSSMCAPEEKHVWSEHHSELTTLCGVLVQSL